MRVTLESTPRKIELNGMPTRIWAGHTEGGVPVQMLVTLVAVPKGDDQAAFEAELDGAPEPLGLRLVES